MAGNNFVQFLRIFTLLTFGFEPGLIFGEELSGWSKPLAGNHTSALRVAVVGSVDIERTWIESKSVKITKPKAVFRFWVADGGKIIVKEEAKLASIRLSDGDKPLKVRIDSGAVMKGGNYPEKLFYIKTMGLPPDLENSVELYIHLDRDTVKDLERELILSKKWQVGAGQRIQDLVFRVSVTVWDRTKSEFADIEFDVPLTFSIVE